LLVVLGSLTGGLRLRHRRGQEKRGRQEQTPEQNVDLESPIHDITLPLRCLTHARLRVAVCLSSRGSKAGESELNSAG
jgi:hypothetical protein